jgi:large subunit ribosomal protein L32
VKNSVESTLSEKKLTRSNSVAVQQNRRTRATRDKRRFHDKLKAPTLSVNATTGEQHLRHHITPDGYDCRGERRVLVTDTVYDEDGE